MSVLGTRSVYVCACVQCFSCICACPECVFWVGHTVCVCVRLYVSFGLGTLCVRVCVCMCLLGWAHCVCVCACVCVSAFVCALVWVPNDRFGHMECVCVHFMRMWMCIGLRVSLCAPRKS